jgi:hypothetical protein
MYDIGHNRLLRPEGGSQCYAKVQSLLAQYRDDEVTGVDPVEKDPGDNEIPGSVLHNGDVVLGAVKCHL